MNPYRGATIPLHVDFLGPAKLLRRKLKARSSKEPRYFLYAVRRKVEPGARPGGGESVAYVVRDGALPEDVRSSVPGTAWELIAGFVDRAEATEAFLRLQRGFGSPTRARLDDPLPPWVAATCRPPGDR
jgi:hypothetical protein